jgi:hypothetical protein
MVTEEAMGIDDSDITNLGLSKSLYGTTQTQYINLNRFFPIRYKRSSLNSNENINKVKFKTQKRIFTVIRARL